MSNKDAEEARAKRWLKAQGYHSMRPHWLKKGDKKGLVPDFWSVSKTHDPSRLWVEVKSPEDDDVFALLRKHDAVRERVERNLPPGLRGDALLHYGDGTAQQAVQWVLNTFARKVSRYIGQKVTLAFVQQTVKGKDFKRVEIAATVPEVVWVRGAGDEPLRAPMRVAREYKADAVLFRDDGTQQTGKVLDFFGWNTPAECALVVRLDPAERPLEGIGVMSGGGSDEFERTIAALEYANRQIKKACETRDAPSIVVLAPRDMLTHPQIMQSACYGRMGLTFRLRDGEVTNDDNFHHGLDGVFRPTKNTHISAAVHVREDGQATLYPNPYALHPISDDAAIFRGAARADVNFVQPARRAS